jgi:hypothetical protein
MIALLTTGITAFAGLVLYMAGSLLLGLNPGSPLALPAPSDLVLHGPLGFAAWMALIMACGAPVVGLAVFAMLYFGRPYAD